MILKGVSTCSLLAVSDFRLILPGVSGDGVNVSCLLAADTDVFDFADTGIATIQVETYMYTYR